MNTQKLMTAIVQKQAKLQNLMANVYELNSFTSFKEEPNEKMQSFIKQIETQSKSPIVQISVFVDEAKSYTDAPNEAGIVCVTLANGTTLNIPSFSSDFYLDGNVIEFVEVGNFSEEALEEIDDEDEYIDTLQELVSELEGEDLSMNIFWALEGTCGNVNVAPSSSVKVSDLDNSLQELREKIETGYATLV